MESAEPRQADQENDGRAGTHTQRTRRADYPGASAQVGEQRAAEMDSVAIASCALAQVMDNPLPLFLREPLGLSGTDRQVDQEDDAQQDGWQPFDQDRSG